MVAKNEEAEKVVRELIQTLPEEWKKGMNPESLRGLIRETSRELPIELYQFLKEKMFSFLLEKEDMFAVKLKLVIDSNIIIRDAFRVARGIPSTTLRLLSSPFVELIAPKQIIEEVYEQIRKDIPSNADLTVALTHAREILKHVIIVDDISIITATLGYSKKVSGNDAYFLGLTITSKARAIVSGDKRAFEGHAEIRRWEMSDTSEAIVSLESGVLSFSLFSVGIELSGEVLKYLIFPLLAAIAEIIESIGTLLVAGASGIVKALEKIPEWVWIAILFAVVAILIAAAVNEEFRNKIGNFGSSVYEFLVEISEASLSFLKDIITAIVDLIRLLIDALGPPFVTFGSAIFLTLTDFLPYLEVKRIGRSA